MWTHRRPRRRVRPGPTPTMMPEGCGMVGDACDANGPGAGSGDKQEEQATEEEFNQAPPEKMGSLPAARVRVAGREDAC